MSGALRKTMVYLGLAEDDDRYSAYDEYEDEDFDPAGVEDEEQEEAGPAFGHGRSSSGMSERARRKRNIINSSPEDNGEEKAGPAFGYGRSFAKLEWKSTWERKPRRFFGT